MISKEIIIIIAEDDKGHYVLTQNLLRKAGISNEIIWLTDGQEILDFLKMQGHGDKRDPQKNYLLLLDIRMPKIDGFEVLTILRQDPVLKDIPVIVITTSDFPDNITRCEELGCAGYAVKPLRQDFIQTLEKAAAAV